MKTIKNSKEITTLEVGDVVVFGNLKYEVRHVEGYFLSSLIHRNDEIFLRLNIPKINFIKNLGITAVYKNWSSFPETYSLEALTAIVSALFKEYEKQNELPTTWVEFCEKNPIKTEEYLINSNSTIRVTSRPGDSRNAIIDKNYFVSKQEAEAFLALNQLRQLRKAYVKDWEPNYKQQHYGIILNINGLDILPYEITSRSMTFPTYELAKQFLTNFKDLLEIAKPLL